MVVTSYLSEDINNNSWCFSACIVSSGILVSVIGYFVFKAS